MDEHPTDKGTISLSTAKLVFGEPPSKMKRLAIHRNGHPLQEDLFADGAAARRVKRSPPKIPLQDNTPEGMQALLAANRHYRQVPWPSPYHRTTHRLHRGDARDLSWIARIEARGQGRQGPQRALSSHTPPVARDLLIWHLRKRFRASFAIHARRTPTSA